MEKDESFEIYEGIVVPESPLLKRERSNRYGSVPGLNDEELIEPAEVERVFLREAFAPILALPVKTKKGFIKPNVDDDGRVEWGAFGTVDFDRYVEFDKLRYKADKLREELFADRIMLEMLSERIKDKNKYVIIKRVYKGTLDLGEIADFDMYCLAERYLRAKRKQRVIAELEAKSREKREEKAEKIFGS
jgi:hypothetical protein